jgi:hypothetical protein
MMHWRKFRMSAQRLAIFFERVIVELFPIVDALMFVDALRTLNLQIMFCQKNFWIIDALMFMSGFASTHFVK